MLLEGALSFASAAAGISFGRHWSYGQ